MKKTSQTQPVDATPALPEQVTVAMAEIAENMHEGLLALAVGAGLQVMQALMDADVTALAGPKGNTTDAHRGAARPRTRVGDPGRSTGAGDPPAGAGRRRVG